MGIQSLQSSGGVDWSKYNIFNYESTIQNSSTPLIYSTAVNISGKGYIKNITFFSQSSSGGLKITVDDSVVFEAYGGSNMNILGLVQEESLSLYNGSISARAKERIAIVKIPRSYPYISLEAYPNTDHSVCILSQPIFFKKNLKVEVKHLDSNGQSVITANGGIV